MNYIFRHWDRNNFSGTNSRVKLYDRNKVKLVDGNLVPKKGYKLKDIELKWKSGKKFNILTKLNKNKYDLILLADVLEHIKKEMKGKPKNLDFKL